MIFLFSLLTDIVIKGRLIIGENSAASVCLYIFEIV